MEPKPRLRALREAKGLSQKQVARMLGVEAATVNRHENGNRQLEGWAIDRYCTLYGVKPYDLWEQREAAALAS